MTTVLILVGCVHTVHGTYTIEEIRSVTGVVIGLIVDSFDSVVLTFSYRVRVLGFTTGNPRHRSGARNHRVRSPVSLRCPYP